MVGIATGIVSALLLVRFLESLLFEVTVTDPPTFAGVALLLTAVALGASLAPARRASRVDPATALRDE